MNEINIEDRTYELLTNYKDAFNEEEFKEKYTDYFYDYDYIVGDIAYNKLRLKGFYDAKNKKVNQINNFNKLKKCNILGMKRVKHGQYEINNNSKWHRRYC